MPSPYAAIRQSALLEEGGAQVLPNVNQGSDQNVIGLLRVEDIMRLKAKAAKAHDEPISSDADTREICQ